MPIFVRRALLPVLTSLFVGLSPAWAAEAGPALPRLPRDLTLMSFDDLMKVEVTSVSRRPEPVEGAAAAIFVLSGDEIRRSGVRNIADALRLVPGLQVAQFSASAYAITARGFNNKSADKLEVLLDGRSVYTPLTSTVFWDVLEVYLPNIERIEVIRGTGAALWGANAVNGVINIITRNARDTTGASAQAHVGTEERYGGAGQIGLAVGEHGSVRLYSQGHARDRSMRPDGSDPGDGQRMAQTGFRSDWDIGSGQLLVSGDVYKATGETRSLDPAHFLQLVDVDSDGGNLVTRYTCCDTEQGRWTLQASYDAHTLDAPSIIVERRKTTAADFQQQWQFGARQTVVYGLSYRYSHDDTGGPPNLILLDPASRTLHTYSAFLQDQIALFDRSATLTVGSKFEHNSFTGFELQPSVRLGWQATERVFTWTAVSRAVRTPNRSDQNVAIFCPEPDGIPTLCGPGLFRIGNPNMDSEKLIAYEWGLRLRGPDHVSWDLATYYNRYSELKSNEPIPPVGAYANKLHARGYGAELSVLWQPLDGLQLRPFYSLLVLDVEPDADSADTATPALLEGSNPRHQAGLAVSWMTSRWTVSSLLRYVDGLAQTAPPRDDNPTDVDAYVELDVRVARSFAHGIEVGLVGRNLLHDHHAEFGDVDGRGELQRSGFAEIRWNW